MRKWPILFIIIVLLLVFAAYNNSNPKAINSRLARKGDIRSGELTYRVYLLGIVPVGEATLYAPKREEYKGQKVFHLSAYARSLKLFLKFFSGEANLDSYIDTQEFNPILFKQRIIVSGKPDINKEIVYDQKNGIMSIGDIRRQILPNTNDPLSVVFKLRGIDFDKVKELELNLNTNQKNYIMKGTATQQDILINNRPLKITVLKADISRRDKNPYHKSNITMILLKEEENIPVLIKVFASGMFINAKLVDIK